MWYDEVPPSSNTNSGVGGRGHHHGIARTKLKWEGILQYMLMAAKVPRPLPFVEVSAELQFKDAGRRRDADNWHFAISKPLGDALVKGGWISDDTPDFYTFGKVEISKVKLATPNPMVKGRLILRLESPDEAPR